MMHSQPNADILAGSGMRVSVQQLLDTDDSDYLEQVSDNETAADIYKELISTESYGGEGGVSGTQPSECISAAGDTSKGH